MEALFCKNDNYGVLLELGRSYLETNVQIY